MAGYRLRSVFPDDPAQRSPTLTDEGHDADSETGGAHRYLKVAAKSVTESIASRPLPFLTDDGTETVVADVLQSL